MAGLPPGYRHYKLTAGSYSATVFLPGGWDAYYRASRFDHGTMIGEVRFGGATLFGSSYWRAPHDPEWTEAGVGLASEWGCGEDGHSCSPGWEDGPPSYNGVLGYDTAKPGEAFLKIGVGLLIKGSCIACGPAGGDDTYKFNSPYRFFSPPRWTSRVERGAADAETWESVTMEHAARLGAFAYELNRTVLLRSDGMLRVETTLRNVGARSIRTPYYSHNLLSVDDRPTGPGMRLGLDVRMGSYADCPPWAAPLSRYFALEDADTTVVSSSNASLYAPLRAYRTVEAPTRIKAVYSASNVARSSGTYRAILEREHLLVTSRLEGPLPLHAYNLYAEERTLSPEPIQMVALEAGEQATLAHTLTVARLPPRDPAATAAAHASASTAPQWQAAWCHKGFLKTG